MLTCKYVTVEGTEYTVTISDDNEALQAAYAAGGAVIGIWRGTGDGPDFSSCLYAVTDPEDADEPLLERAVRRRMGMPWVIGRTKRLIIREFKKDDPLETPEGIAVEGELTFCVRELRDAYIEEQYVYHERGLWALEEKESGVIVGKAGITGCEMGYHIYPAFRRRGYAFEACGEIISYARDRMDADRLFLRIHGENTASVTLARRLGFTFTVKRDGVLFYERNLR